jgi:hypothetical protein
MENEFKILAAILIIIISGFIFLIHHDIENNEKKYNYIMSLPASEQLALFQNCAKNYSLICQNSLYDYQKQH